MDKKEAFERYMAQLLASEAIDRVAGPKTNAPSGTFLTRSFAPRSDLPVTAAIRVMAEPVARKLATMGLNEPVSLQRLPGLWWKTKIDAAELGQVSEYGCAFVTRYLSTERLAHLGFEVVDGPFIPWETQDVSRAILIAQKAKYWDARIANRPLLPNTSGSVRFESMDDAYTSEDLLDALDSEKEITVFSGPFDSPDDAHCALDVRWEVPE
jgi:hypothetical protein